jgi:hypothetical protein
LKLLGTSGDIHGLNGCFVLFRDAGFVSESVFSIGWITARLIAVA